MKFSIFLIWLIVLSLAFDLFTTGVFFNMGYSGYEMNVAYRLGGAWASFASILIIHSLLILGVLYQGRLNGFFHYGLVVLVLMIIAGHMFAGVNNIFLIILFPLEDMDKSHVLSMTEIAVGLAALLILFILPLLWYARRIKVHPITAQALMKEASVW